MAPFRWSSIENDIALAREVAASRPEKPNDWDEISTRLSEHFSTDEKPVELKARSCRDEWTDFCPNTNKKMQNHLKGINRVCVYSFKVVSD